MIYLFTGIEVVEVSFEFVFLGFGFCSFDLAVFCFLDFRGVSIDWVEGSGIVGEVILGKVFLNVLRWAFWLFLIFLFVRVLISFY